MRIAVRMDDITPDMDWQRFFAFKELLDQYGVKPLIGVVPDNQDEMLHFARPASAPADFWAYIRELQEQGWVIAMHGYTHIYTTGQGGLFPLNDFSEFAGLSYEQQKAMLQQGKQILEQQKITTDIFMAPAHAYDRNTLHALKEAGFNKITDGFGTKPYYWNGITFYPISFRLGASFKKKKGFTTMVIHSNTITDEEMESYRRYFREPGITEWIDYQELLQQEPVKRSIWGWLKEYWQAKLKHVLVKYL